MPIVNPFSILRKINNNNFNQCPSAQHLLAVCKQLVYTFRVNELKRTNLSYVGMHCERQALENKTDKSGDLNDCVTYDH